MASMTTTVSYERDDAVAIITLDDGKVNTLSPTMQDNINAALDTAEGDDSKAVVLAGNTKVFCAGFDLGVMASGRDAAHGMLAGGFELSIRLLSFPKPVIIAATGAAVAMGSFLLLSADYRVGSPKKIQANEVTIGMTMPVSAIEIMRFRLTPSAFQRANSLGSVFTGDEAVQAGWLDEVVEQDRVLARAKEFAATVAATVHPAAHRDSKLKARKQALDAIRAGIGALESELVLPS